MRATLSALAGLLLAGACLPAAADPAAAIVSLQGKGDYREAPSSDWKPAKVQQGLEAGQFVRTTQPESKMGLLLADQTQMTLQGVSIVQVKAVDVAGARKSIVDFGKGTGRFQTKTPTKDFRVSTPTGLAAIRGTEWLVEVDDDGRSAFTVVEGAIEISNDLGALAVGADEQGILERGKPPSKRRLQNARERVQWVSAFTIDPSLYPSPRIEPAMAAVRAAEISRARELLAAQVGREGDVAEAHFLLADIELYFGRGTEALAVLDRAATRFPADPRIPGLTSRAALHADDFARARAAAADAVARYPETLESQLAAGEVARLDGDAPAARRALRHATRIAPADARAWLALGQLHADRADPRRARRALGEADRLAPNNAAVLGELGLVEANAYDLPRARSLLDRALAAQPDDFASWTGLGIARLKSGDAAGAQDALLRATLIEPRYARAHIYLAVAYWQQERRQDALAELRTASLHDPRDPVPYQLAAMMQSDLLRPGDALAEARESIARLGYVKSLDAIANNLRGGANLGAPLAQLGLEAWALKNAQDSFDPLWAGSHLFLADRLPGKFLGNSELVQGFLVDPLAFGASNRFQTLVVTPGNYGTLALRASRSSDATLTEPLANVNGLVGEGRFAYFLEGTRLKTWVDDGIDRARASSVTVGLGARPRDDLGLFLYANRLNPETQQGSNNSQFSPYTLVDGQATRIDAGIQYRHGPDWQLWIKGGHGSEDARIQGREITTLLLGQARRDSLFTSQPRRGDFGARATCRVGPGVEISLTAEGAYANSVDVLERDAILQSDVAAPRVLESVRQDIEDESRSVALGVRWPIRQWLLFDVEADHTRYEKTNAILVRRDFVNQLVPLTDDHEKSKWSPRAGIVARPGAGFTLRAVHQQWLRPASTASLKPASTAGIALDERYVLAGGRLERTRGQVEWEGPANLFAMAFTDRQEIDNLYSPLIGVLNNRPDTSNLERLRNRSFNALASLSDLEGFPELSKGELRESGLALNALIARRISLFAEGVRATSENTGAYPGKELALLPRNRYALGATFFSDDRWNLAAKWVRRGERFLDEANTQRLPAEWSGAVQGYWETRDKRWSVELIVVNIGAKSADEAVGVAVNLRF